MGETAARPRGAECLAWVEGAWQDWLGGRRSWAELGRKYGHNRHTVRASVLRYAGARAASYTDGPDPLAEYVDGLTADLARALAIAGDPAASPRCQVTALKLATHIREKLAAARGVVTRREGRDHSGRVEVEGHWSDLTDAELLEIVAA